MRVDESGQTWVQVTNPATGGTAEVTEAALEEVWAEKGWVLDEPDAAVDPNASPPPPEGAEVMTPPDVTPAEPQEETNA
jgi:hypothetical protein